MARVFLASGETVLVDKRMVPLVSKYKWYRNSKGYAQCNWYDGTKYTTKKMHRVILRTPNGTTVDHINGNKLDNRVRNLRLCNYSQNSANCKKYKNNTSGFKGVHRSGKSWRAMIRVNYRLLSLGCFSAIEDAARAYNKAAKKYFGRFARVNQL